MKFLTCLAKDFTKACRKTRSVFSKKFLIKMTGQDDYDSFREQLASLVQKQEHKIVKLIKKKGYDSPVASVCNEHGKQVLKVMHEFYGTAQN